MQIEIPDRCDVRAQAVAAGFANVDDYVVSLVERDAERVAIQEGLEAMKAGRTRTFEDFDREFRQEQNLSAAQ
jgi:hypothetical protein